MQRLMQRIVGLGCLWALLCGGAVRPAGAQEEAVPKLPAPPLLDIAAVGSVQAGLEMTDQQVQQIGNLAVEWQAARREALRDLLPTEARRREKELQQEFNGRVGKIVDAEQLQKLRETAERDARIAALRNPLVAESLGIGSRQFSDVIGTIKETELALRKASADFADNPVGFYNESYRLRQDLEPKLLDLLAPAQRDALLAIPFEQP